MNVLNSVVSWFKSKGGFAHVVFGLFSVALLAYSTDTDVRNAFDSIYNGMPAWVHRVGVLVIAFYAWYKNTNNGQSSFEKNTGGTSKLGAWALISLLLMGTTVGCSTKSVAQDIVNWTPTIESTATTVATVVASLDPANAVIIEAAVTGFNAAAGLLSNQAQTYLNNPTLPVLQQLQAQALSFQQNVNAALLQAVRITNPASEQRVLAAIQGLSTALTAVLALISTIKGNTLTKTLMMTPAPIHTSQITPFINHDSAVAMVAAHYNESTEDASAQIDAAYLRLQTVGL